MTKERAMGIARKIETIATLSKGIQTTTRKNPADSKIIATLLYNIGGKNDLPKDISKRNLVDFAKAFDAQRPAAELREILFPAEKTQRVAKERELEHEHQQQALDRTAKLQRSSNQEKPSQGNQLSAPEQYAPAKARHQAHNNTVWAELSRVQEEQARVEELGQKKKKREAQAALRKQLEKQKKEKEAYKLREKMQEDERAQRVVKDVQLWQNEQKQERENEKRRHATLEKDLKSQRDELRRNLDKQRRAKAEEERQAVESIERQKQEAATAEERRRQQQLEQFKKQNRENERLQQWKKEQKQKQRKEAAILGKKYCDEVEAKEQQREQELRRKAEEVQHKMERYTQGRKDVDMRAIENERRAAIEQMKREEAMNAEEQRRVAKLQKAAADQRQALAQQTQTRRAMREQSKLREKQQARDFLTSERQQMQQRVEGEARKRQQSKLQQSKWLAEQLREKKQMQSDPLNQADISRTELSMNKRLLATVAATARSVVIRERVGQHVQESSREE